jgi:hypothetical protein
MKDRKRRKERRGVARKIWEGWIKRKKNKSARKDVTLLRDEISLFFQPCAIQQRGRHRCLVVIIFLLPLHMSTILNLLTLDIPTYGLFSWSLALKVKQPLEEVLSLTIFVLIVLAIPIAPLYMLYERLTGGESFIKLV